MKINKENIEEYIFDFLEGNLSENEVSEFKEYINSNNDAKSELDYWKQSYLSDYASVGSTEFSHLKKSNKGLYWSGGIAAAFLLGIGIGYTNFSDTQQPLKKSTEKIIQKEDIQPKQETSPSTTEAVQVEYLEDKKVNESPSNYLEESIQTVEKPVKSSLEVEKLDYLDQRDIELENAEVSREPITKKVEISKNEVSDENKHKHKNSDVDVIELNSEGF